MGENVSVTQNGIVGVIPKVSFAIGVLIEILVVILDKSTYTIQYEGWIFRITFLLFACTVCFTKFSLKEYLYLVFFLIIGYLSYIMTGRNEILRIVIFVAACKDMDMRRILKMVFYVTLAGMVVLILLSVFGIWGTTAITADFGRGIVEIRYCLGIGHPNALHCMFFVLLVLGIYLYHDRWGWKGYLMAALLNGGLYLLTDSRTSMIIGMCFILLAVLLQYIKSLQNAKWCYILAVLFFAFAIGVSVYFAKHCTSTPFLKQLNQFLNGRIIALYDSVRHEGMIYTWSAFSNPLNDNYFDLGIVRAFFWYGWIPASLYFIMQIKLMWVAFKKSDYMMLAVMVAITAYSIIEAHFISVYIGRNYILFFMGMYLADLTGTKTGGREEYFPFFYRLFQRKQMEV